MERMPKRCLTIDPDKGESAVINGLFRVRANPHGRKVRIEVEHIDGAIILTKTIDLPKGGKVG